MEVISDMMKGVDSQLKIEEIIHTNEGRGEHIETSIATTKKIGQTR